MLLRNILRYLSAAVIAFSTITASAYYTDTRYSQTENAIDINRLREVLLYKQGLILYNNVKEY